MAVLKKKGPSHPVRWHYGNSLVVKKKTRWCVVCLLTIHRTVIWETHNLAHAGINRTVARLQLTGYWLHDSRDAQEIEVMQSMSGSQTRR